MNYKLYTTTQKAWDAMLSEINAAEHSVYLEMYILLHDTKESHDFLGALKKKAISGLEVVVIADAFGSSALPNEEIRTLREAGVEFIFFKRWFKRTHRKILIIDNKIAFLGGVNINEKIRNWRDIQIKVGGKIVKQLLRSFAYAYKIVGGKKENILSHSNFTLKQKLKSLITDSFPKKGNKMKLSDYYIKSIFEAKEEIKIVTPYLAPPKRLLAALESSLLKGVKISMIIPVDTDIKILNRVNYLNAYRLGLMGVKMYLSKEMNHAKTMIVDKQLGFVGSQNFDILSFDLNAEAGVFFRQKGIVSDLNELITKWISEANRLEIKKFKFNLFDRMLMFLIKIFYRFI